MSWCGVVQFEKYLHKAQVQPLACLGLRKEIVVRDGVRLNHKAQQEEK